jgi:hypothetical protein
MLTGQGICLYLKDATPVSKTLKCGSLIVALVTFMCRGRKVDETSPKCIFE